MSVEVVDTIPGLISFAHRPIDWGKCYIKIKTNQFQLGIEVPKSFIAYFTVNLKTALEKFRIFKLVVAVYRRSNIL